MGLSSSDLLLVERSGVPYKETFGNRANIEDDDLLLVERSGVPYKCTYSDWDGGSGGGGGGGGGGGSDSYGTHEWANSNGTLSIVTETAGGSADTTSSYRTLSYAMSITGGSGSLAGKAQGRLYIGLRMRGTTSYYHDFCLAGVQFVNNGRTAYISDSTYTNGYDWNFHNTGNTDGSGNWQRCSSSLSSQTYTVDPSTLIYPYGIASSSTNGAWSRGTSTGSTYTGAADGVYSPSGYSGGGGTIISGSGLYLAQSSNTYFIYTETSGSGYTIGTTTLWMRSPQITISNNDRFQAIYKAQGGSNSTNGLGRYTGQDVLYFRFK